MTRCPITYQEFAGPGRYSDVGLRKVSPRLSRLSDLSYTQEEQIEQARMMAARLSIQGVQPKLSAALNISAGRFELVERKGTFIIKPQSLLYEELPENEDLTMHLAESVGLEVPLHFLVYGKDGRLSYCVRRFDRIGRNEKLQVEDFAQLSGRDRETKYDSSLERVASILDRFTTFPLVEKEKLFVLILLSFLVGNEDMHLKNFSLVTAREGILRLSPVYDLLNTTIVLPPGAEESALPLRGKKRNITRTDLLEYFARDRLGLRQRVVEDKIALFAAAVPEWPANIEHSFLSDAKKNAFREVVRKRAELLGL